MSLKKLHINIPSTGFLRLENIIGNPAKNIPAIIPVSRSAWYRGVNNGMFPPKIKIGCSTVWKIEDIHALIKQIDNQSNG